ncbi:MAG: hypothetical protein ABIO04_09355, partial [Ferruginibacter sp.]
MVSLKNNSVRLLFYLLFVLHNNTAIAIPITGSPGSDTLLHRPTLSLFPDPIVTSDSTAVIPFTRAGNLILIAARADTTMGNFILDTGAP